MTLPKGPMVKPPPARKPTYRLMIPTVQLGILSYLISIHDPDMRVSEAYGKGTIATNPETDNVPFGKLTRNVVGEGKLKYKWSYGHRPKLTEIYDSFVKFDIPDISLDRLAIVHKSEVRGESCLLELRFGKKTVHPEVYTKLVLDGSYPQKETALVIKKLKEQLSTTFSSKVLKRIRYSFLILHKIIPHSELIYDASAIYAMCNPKYMHIIEEVYKRWELYDHEYPSKPKS
ncbi:MAG: hypothetical protein IBV52_01540 [Candidatus Bathyarchaeota archaeon]